MKNLHPLIKDFLQANNDSVSEIKKDINKGYRLEIFADINIFAENNEPYNSLQEEEIGYIASDFLDMVEKLNIE